MGIVKSKISGWLGSDDAKTTIPPTEMTTNIFGTKNISTNESHKGCPHIGTTVLTTSTADCNIKYQFELSSGTISSIILGICLFLLILGIILKNVRTFLKKKKRKTPVQESGNNAEDLYTEIDGSRIDQHVLAQRMNEPLFNDTGDYNHLDEIQMTEHKAKSGETILVMDSSGYSHVVRKDRKSGPSPTETNLSNTINSNDCQYEQLIVKEGNIESDEDHGTKEYESLYNHLDNVTSDESKVGNEEKNANHAFENVTYGEISAGKDL